METVETEDLSTEVEEDKKDKLVGLLPRQYNVFNEKNLPAL